MKKFMVWIETEQNYETWLLVDAPSKERAKKIAKEVDGFVELRACSEVKANQDMEGISHKFTILE